MLTLNVDVLMRVTRLSIAISFLVLACQTPVAPAISLQQVGAGRARAGLRGQQQAWPAEALSFLSIDQTPGPTPAYVKYGKPEFTTFNNQTSACQACAEFFPVKEDGKRFHAALHEDSSGGIWERSCRAGLCNFRDPQTDPVGGVIGQGVGPGRKPDGRTCITRDPVPWFADCEPVLLKSTHTLLDATRYCTYREQIFIPPPALHVSRFAGKPVSWARVGGAKEQCLATIQKEGSALFDSITFCDVNMPALSGCCESVFSALSCVAETAFSHGGGLQEGMFSQMSGETSTMLAAFSKYCVPLCQNTKEQFCEKFPGTDICVNPKGCTECTSKGGLWCPKLGSCHCPSKKPPCIKPPILTPLQCFEDKPKPKSDAGPKPLADAGPAKPGPAPDDGKPLCKYSEMARMWKARD